MIQRAIFALSYQETNILLSNQIGPESKILYDRDPKTRVAKVAPWLTLDGDPYPAVVDGRVQWIVDGYTTTNEFPYAARISLRDATADSVNSQLETMPLNAGNITYIRNAVKATVDAYDGTVNVYAWDEADQFSRLGVRHSLALFNLSQQYQLEFSITFVTQKTCSRCSEMF
jgi:uncharacterized membrane protein (UPF0182 family)